MPTTSRIVTAIAIRIAGRLRIAVAGAAVGEDDRRARRRAQERRKADAEVGEEADDVARPADRDRRGAERVLEDQVPADDPRDELAERRVAVGVGRAGHRHGRRELGVAERGQRADDAGEDHRQHDGRTGVRGGGLTGEDEDAGADDGADAERGQIDGPEHALELAFPGRARPSARRSIWWRRATPCTDLPSDAWPPRRTRAVQSSAATMSARRRGSPEDSRKKGGSSAGLLRPVSLRPGQRPVARRRGGAAAAARARRPGGAARAARHRRVEAGADRRVVEGRVRHRGVAARSDPRAARGARRRPAQPDLHPDRPSPRLPLRRDRRVRRVELRSGDSVRASTSEPTLRLRRSEPSARSPRTRRKRCADAGRCRNAGALEPLAAARRRRRVRDGRDDRHRDRLCRCFGQRPPEPRPTMRFTIALPEDTAIDPLRGSVAVSPTARAWSTSRCTSGRPRLFLRTIDRDAPEPIDGSDGAADPFFSPDGEWVGFFAHGSLKKLRVDGGTPVALCAARAGAGASWGARRHDRLRRRTRRRARARVRGRRRAGRARGAGRADRAR